MQGSTLPAGTLLIANASAMFSEIVNVSSKLKSWNTKPKFSLRKTGKGFWFDFRYVCSL